MNKKSAGSPVVTRKHVIRISLIALVVAVIVAALSWVDANKPGPGPSTVVIYKSPTCSCCSKWVTHLKESGFEVEVHNDTDMGARQNELGVPPPLRACHTAVVGGYLVEGHVPAADIRRLLSEKPKARGIAVPGMPIGSPGMEMGNQRDPYKTLLFQADGGAITFAEHGGSQ